MYRDQWTYCCQEWEADDDNQDPYWLRVTSGHKKRAETDSPRREESGRLEIVGGGETEQS